MHICYKNNSFFSNFAAIAIRKQNLFDCSDMEIELSDHHKTIHIFRQAFVLLSKCFNSTQMASSFPLVLWLEHMIKWSLTGKNNVFCHRSMLPCRLPHIRWSIKKVVYEFIIMTSHLTGIAVEKLVEPRIYTTWTPKLETRRRRRKIITGIVWN